MERKGCPKFEGGKAAILDFKMADPKFSLFRYILTEKAPRVLILGEKYVIGVNKHTGITCISIAWRPF